MFAHLLLIALHAGTAHGTDAPQSCDTELLDPPTSLLQVSSSALSRSGSQAAAVASALSELRSVLKAAKPEVARPAWYSALAQIRSTVVEAQAPVPMPAGPIAAGAVPSAPVAPVGQKAIKAHAALQADPATNKSTQPSAKVHPEELPQLAAAGTKIAPFGKEDTATQLTMHAARTQDTLVDAVENAEVAEVKRAVFRALTRLRAASIKEFDTIARLETQAIDEYNDAHHYREENPLSYLHSDEPRVKEDKYTSFH